MGHRTCSRTGPAARGTLRRPAAAPTRVPQQPPLRAYPSWLPATAHAYIERCNDHRDAKEQHQRVSAPRHHTRPHRSALTGKFQFLSPPSTEIQSRVGQVNPGNNPLQRSGREIGAVHGQAGRARRTEGRDGCTRRDSRDVLSGCLAGTRGARRCRVRPSVAGRSSACRPPDVRGSSGRQGSKCGQGRG